jgi:hypothetical protein
MGSHCGLPQAFYCHVVRWRHVSHPNVLPFLGVFQVPPPQIPGLVSPRMPSNILEHIGKNKDANRLRLVSTYGIDGEKPADHIIDSWQMLHVASNTSIHYALFTGIWTR